MFRCKDCQDREPGCHGGCVVYAEDKAARLVVPDGEDREKEEGEGVIRAIIIPNTPIIGVYDELQPDGIPYPAESHRLKKRGRPVYNCIIHTARGRLLLRPGEYKVVYKG